MRQQLSFEGAFAQGDEDVPFRYLPFDVPAGAPRLAYAAGHGRVP